MQSKRILVAAIVMVTAILTASVAQASVVTYTSSSAFLNAIGGNPSLTLGAENFGGGTNGQPIAQNGTFDGLTFTFSNPPSSGIITNLYNSVSGLSLSGNNGPGADFFFGGQSFTVTFPAPIFAIGGFFNVNPNSGTYTISTGVGAAVTGSASYDTSTFVFGGIISTTPFTSATFSSQDVSLGSFNVAEIFSAAPAAVPEPATLLLFGTALTGLGLIRRRKVRQARRNCADGSACA